MPTSNEVSIKVTVDDQASKVLTSTVRLFQQLQKEAAETASSFRSINKDLSSLNESLSKATTESQQLGSALGKTERELRDVGRAAKVNTGEMLDMSLALADVGRSLSAAGDFGARHLTAFVNAGADFEVLRKSFVSTFKSVEAADSAIAKLRQAAQDPGLTFDVAAKAARNFGALGIGIDESITLTRGFANAAALSGTSTDQLREGLRQVGQALSRTKLEQEDLNSITERFGALVPLIRREYGATAEEINAKLKETGQTSRDFFKTITDLSKVAQADADTLANSFSNLQNAITQAQQAIGTELIPITKSLTNGITILVEQFNNLPRAAKAAAAAIVTVGTVTLKSAGGLLEFVGNISLLLIALPQIRSLFSSLGAVLKRINLTRQLSRDIRATMKGAVELQRTLTGQSGLISSIGRFATSAGRFIARIGGIAFVIGGIASAIPSAIRVFKDLLTILRYVGRAFVSTGKFIQRHFGYLEEGGKKTRNVIRNLIGLTDTYKDLRSAVSGAIDGQDRFTESLKRAEETTNRTAKSMRELIQYERQIEKLGLRVPLPAAIIPGPGQQDAVTKIFDDADKAREKQIERQKEVIANANREFQQQVRLARSGQKAQIEFDRIVEDLRKRRQAQEVKDANEQFSRRVKYNANRRASELAFQKLLEDSLRIAQRIRKEEDERSREGERHSRTLRNNLRSYGDFVRNIEDKIQDAARQTNRLRGRLIKGFTNLVTRAENERVRKQQAANQALADSDKERVRALRELRESSLAEEARQIRELQGFYNQTNRILEQTQTTLGSLTNSFREAADAGIIGARTLANVFASATMAIEGTAEAIKGIETAAVGLSSGDPLSTISGILSVIGGTVSVITSFINLFKSFQRESVLEQAGLAGQTRADRPIGVSTTSTRIGSRRSSASFNAAARREATSNIGLAPPITVVNYIEVDGKTTQEIIKTTDRFIQSGRATRRRSPRRPTQ